MCGRFTLTWRERERIAEELGVPVEEINDADFKPRWNVAPTDKHLIVRMRYEDRHAMPAKWGLVNTWAKDAKRAAKQINARAETVDTNPAFHEAFTKRRCVVPADGFFEWLAVGKERRPIWYHRPDGKLILFAGLYESWQPELGDWQRTFTIVTTGANDLIAPVHDRMPVILPEALVDEWLDPLKEDPAELKQYLVPASPDVLIATPVSMRANSVKNDHPSVLEPAEPEEAQKTLL